MDAFVATSNLLIGYIVSTHDASASMHRYWLLHHLQSSSPVDNVAAPRCLSPRVDYLEHESSSAMSIGEGTSR